MTFMCMPDALHLGEDSFISAMGNGILSGLRLFVEANVDRIFCIKQICQVISIHAKD